MRRRWLGTIREGAVDVVREALHNDRHPTRAVALKGALIEIPPIKLARPPLDGTLDVLGGHRALLGGLDSHTEPDIDLGTTAARFGSDNDLFGELGEELAAHGILFPLAETDVMPFAMARHNSQSS